MEKIHNYMAESLLSISPTASVLEALHVMNDNEIHSLLVSKKRENILASLPITISVRSW
jgi:predicted transcriptional regulator